MNYSVNSSFIKNFVCANVIANIYFTTMHIFWAAKNELLGHTKNFLENEEICCTIQFLTILIKNESS